MKRIAVYGNASTEKEKFVNNLQTSSTEKFSFESSTPTNRFTRIDNGAQSPIYTAPWQLLVVTLNDERLEGAPNFESLFPQPDLNRPLIIIFYGEENEKTKGIVNSYKDSLAAEQLVRIISTEDLENVFFDDLINAFYDLEESQKQFLDPVNSLL